MIHPTAVIYPGVTIDDDVRIGAYAVVGGPPEHRDYFNGEETKGVVIKRGARIFEFVTIHAGTKNPTTVGKNAAVFNHSHIGHDSVIDRGAIIGGNVSLAGHCYVMEGANVSGKSCLVQHCVVGAYAFLGGNSFLTKHLPPGEKWVGNSPRFVSANDIGITRAGLSYLDVIGRYGPQFTSLTKDKPL